MISNEWFPEKLENTPIRQQAFAELANKFASNEHDDLILNITVYLLIAFVMIDGLFWIALGFMVTRESLQYPVGSQNTTQSEITIHFDNAGLLNYQF